MRRTRNKQIMTIALVMVAVVGLTVGFASFASQLTIKSSAAITPNASDFSVVFSKTQNSTSTADVEPLYSFTSPAEKNATADKGKINNKGTNGPEMTNLTAHFTEPGQTVTYEFYARNEGEYLAYLNYINIGDKSCTKITVPEDPSQEAQSHLVSAACNAISVSVKVGDLGETKDSINLNGEGKTHTLDKKTSEKVVVTIEYASDGTRVDGAFSVTFGDIELIYSTVQDYVDLEQGSSSNQNSPGQVKDEEYYGISYIARTDLGEDEDSPTHFIRISESKAPAGFYDNYPTYEASLEQNDAWAEQYRDYLIEIGNFAMDKYDINWFFIDYGQYGLHAVKIYRGSNETVVIEANNCYC